MSMFVWGMATLWILVVLALVVVLVTEVMAGFRPAGGAPPPGMQAPSHVVLMPAHDEAAGIADTVAAVLAQLSPRGRLLVVADNCSDDTAARARAAGAEVIERSNPSLRGKGYALAFGVAHLKQEPPEVVAVLDADCIPAPKTLDTLAIRAAQLRRPVQALDLMLAPPGSPLRLRMAAFAWAMHNDLRPRGLHRLGLPCQLMGTGMALPWCCIGDADLASGHLAEDVRLGLSLAGAGYAPCFCPEARVESWFPQDRAGLESQRKRWEHGHLATILSVVPRTLWRGLRFHNLGAVVLALDLCVPPLALLALLVTLSCGFGVWLAGTEIAQPAFAVAAVSRSWASPRPSCSPGGVSAGAGSPSRSWWPRRSTCSRSCPCTSASWRAASGNGYAPAGHPERIDPLVPLCHQRDERRLAECHRPPTPCPMTSWR